MNRTKPEPIQQIAEFATGIAQSEIPVPPTVAELCREMMLNAAGAALAGAAHPDGVALARVVRGGVGGNGRSTIIGMGMRTSPVYASLVNGTLVRLAGLRRQHRGFRNARHCGRVSHRNGAGRDAWILRAGCSFSLRCRMRSGCPPWRNCGCTWLRRRSWCSGGVVDAIGPGR